MRNWRPLYTGSTAVAFEKTIRGVKTDLLLSIDAENHPGFLVGKAGISLFLAYLSRLDDDPSVVETYSNLISESFNDIKSSKLDYGMCSGYTGILWALNHMNKNQFLEVDVDSVAFEIEESIYKKAKADLQKGLYDYFYNGIGILNYFLEKEFSPRTEGYVADLIDAVHDSAKRDGKYFYWPKIDDGAEIYDLGLPHGMPGIMAVLSRAASITGSMVCRDMLEGGAEWILNNKLPLNSSSMFSAKVIPNATSTHSRLGWCYGDIGIAHSLYVAGKSLRSEELMQESIDVLLFCAGRKDLRLNNVNDACMCHGSSSLAHMFNHYYQVTGLDAFRSAAKHWYEVTMNFRIEEQGGAVKFKYWVPDEGFVRSDGLLNGSAGVALALMAAITNDPPLWDNFLLMS